MASKKTKKAPSAVRDDNLDELFSGIAAEAQASHPTPPPAPAATATTATTQPSKTSKLTPNNDILADLESQLAAEQPTSRPHTPRLKDGFAGVRRSTATPPTADDRTAGVARKSTDSAQSLRATFTPSATSSELHDAERRGTIEQELQHAQTQPSTSASGSGGGGGSGGGAGGGWWGGILSTASAAMKQAEAAYKEIQHNEEAKKWADQVRGLRSIDVGALKNYGDELRNRALPTFTTILHTLAPPISAHERLLIHITHDLVGYPSLDPLIHAVFSRVMAQVEGGDLLVVQRGRESSSRRPSADASSAGWRDGPWWRQTDGPRDLGLVQGITEGTKLCRASAESYAAEHCAAHGGLDQAKRRATEHPSESNPVRTSDIFLAVQAVATDADRALFARTASAERDKDASAVKEQATADDEHVCFTLFLLDPVHEIEYATVSQAVPAKWVRWLDAVTRLTPPSTAADDHHDDDKEPQPQQHADGLPDEVRQILDDGGVDPREWVAEWVEETLNLAVGVVAQRYVARRMGVGEGGLGRGKSRADGVMHAQAAEAARAGVI